MTRGTFDYGLPVNTQSEYVEHNLNELSSRLQPIYALNRSGSIIQRLYPNNLTNSNIVTNTGARGHVLPSVKHQMYNIPSAKCVTGTTDQDEIGFSFNSPVFSGDQIGLCFYGEVYSFTNSIFLEFKRVLNNVYSIAKLALNLSNGELYLWNDAGAWELVTTMLVPIGAGMALTVKFSFDLLNKKYGFLWFGSNNVFNLSSYNLYQAATAAADTCINRYYLKTDGAAEKVIYISDVIITINELV